MSDLPNLSELSMEIARLRTKIDGLKNSEKTVVIPNFDKEKSEAYALYQATVLALDEKRKQKKDLQDAIINQRLSTEAELNERLRLLAELQKAAQEAAFFEKMEQDLKEYLGQIESWKLAADFQKQDILETFKAYRLGKNGMLNANDMGLGKTMEGILSLVLLKAEFKREFNREPRVLWLTKQSLIYSTIREFGKWNPEYRIVPISGSLPVEVRETLMSVALQNNMTIISNYEIVNTTKVFRDMDWDFVVVDECHKLKGGANPGKKSQIWTNTKDVCRRARFIMMLSGTPMVNRPQEMWAYLHVFDPERFDDLRRFERIFGIFDQDTGQMKLDADKLLKQALIGQVIRRRKDEVGLQLPDLIHSYRYLEMTTDQRELYDHMRSYFYIWLQKQIDDNPGKPLAATAIIAQMTRLRQISVWAGSIKYEDDGVVKRMECNESSKVNEAMDIIEELNDDGENVVIFSTFNEPIFEIQRRCRAQGIVCETIAGENNDPRISEKFQNNEIRVLCINMAMSEGLNLQKSKEWEGGASHAIMMDLWWTPARNEQAEARIHRTGATENCTIHILHNEDSIDAFIASKIEDKSEQFANILERKEVRPASDWKNLLEGLI
jgi:SWI/SNF-related matrix-associated actin-dependent regulator 1 of chromatin subfamily A